MNYGEIKTADIANGEGVRVTLFVSGCQHHCKNCFNPETWDFNYGKPFTADVQNEILTQLDKSYINGLTLLGGEPMDVKNQPGLVPLLHAVRERFPQKTIWCYTGYVFEPDVLNPEGRAHCAVTDEMLSLLDVLVDGPFIEAQKDITLVFRGSANQRILDVQKSVAAGKGVLYDLPQVSMKKEK